MNLSTVMPATNLYAVMPGLVPSIHVLTAVTKFKDVDGRDIGVRKHAVLSDG